MSSLTRATVTVASKIMLPTYAVIDTVIGAIWMLQDRSRTSPAIVALQALGWPIEASGGILLVLGLLLLAGMLVKIRAAAATVVAAGAVTWLTLSAIYLHAALGDPHTSLSTPLLPLGWAVAHVATLASLAADELSDQWGNRRAWEEPR